MAWHISRVINNVIIIWQKAAAMSCHGENENRVIIMAHGVMYISVMAWHENGNQAKIIWRNVA
jgi:hypothetical protein